MRRVQLYPPTLLCALAALTGNAELAGADIVLFMIMPVWSLLVIRAAIMKRREVRWTLGCLLLLAIIQVRAVQAGIPYFEGYWLWPIKAALFMALLLIQPSHRWPHGNHLALLCMCLLMLACAEYDEGRMYSLFGPNMLYRIFGLLLIMSAALYVKSRSKHRWALGVLFGLGAALALATGSVGALSMIVLGCVVLLIRTRKRTRVLLLMVFVAACVSSAGMQMLSVFDGSVTVARLMYKGESIGELARVAGWLRIIEEPMEPFGLDYGAFSDLWSEGYSYPHNMYVELWAFYGLIGLIVCVMSLSAVALVFRRLDRLSIVSGIFLVVTAGAMLSGDLSDNYASISVACFVCVKVMAEKGCRTRTGGIRQSEMGPDGPEVWE